MRKILPLLKQQATLLPDNMEAQITEILTLSASGSGELLSLLNTLIETLDQLLIQSGFNIRPVTVDDTTHQLLQDAGLNSTDSQPDKTSLWGYFTGEKLTGIHWAGMLWRHRSTTLSGGAKQNVSAELDKNW